jgi:hypothetical protein
MNVLDGGTGNNILINAIIANNLLSPTMPSSFATTATTHNVSALAESQSSQSAPLAHPHA